MYHWHGRGEGWRLWEESTPSLQHPPKSKRPRGAPAPSHSPPQPCTGCSQQLVFTPSALGVQHTEMGRGLPCTPLPTKRPSPGMAHVPMAPRAAVLRPARARTPGSTRRSPALGASPRFAFLNAVHTLMPPEPQTACVSCTRHALAPALVFATFPCLSPPHIMGSFAPGSPTPQAASSPAPTHARGKAPCSLATLHPRACSGNHKQKHSKVRGTRSQNA